MVECTKSWQPNKLCVVWTRRSRRKTTELLSWQPTIQNPYRGLVVWPVPENIDITVTLFQDPKATEYEDKVMAERIQNNKHLLGHKDLPVGCLYPTGNSCSCRLHTFVIIRNGIS